MAEHSVSLCARRNRAGVMAAASFAFIRVSRGDDARAWTIATDDIDLPPHSIRLLGAAGRGFVRGSLHADLIRFGDVAGAGLAQHAFRLVLFRRGFLERVGRDGSHSGRAARPLGRAQPLHEPHRDARLRQDGVRVLGVLGLPGVRAVHRDLVRRLAGRNFLPRSADTSHAVVAAVGGVPGSDLADSVHGADERADQKNAGDSWHRVALWASSGCGSSATCWWFRRCRSTRFHLG